MSRSEISRHSSPIFRVAAILLGLACLLLLPALTPNAEAKGRKVSAASQQPRRDGVAPRHRLDSRLIARASSKTSSKGKGHSTEQKPAPEASSPTEPTPIPSEGTPVSSPVPTEPVPTLSEGPTSTPTEPITSSGLLFSGSSVGDFWLNQSAPNAVREVADPTGGAENVFNMTVADTDVYPITPTDNPRAQLVSPPSIESGDEIWWHSRFYLPGSFPSSVPGWLNLLEGPYGAPYNGSPPWQIQVVGNYIQWTRNKTYAWDVPWRMPLVKEKWVDVLVHERFGSSGWVEMWIDGQPITFFAGGTYNPSHVAPATRLNMATMDSSNNGGPNSIILQSYRQAGMFSSVSVYEGQLQLGSTRASVGG
jgi:hypothetical protein